MSGLLIFWEERLRGKVRGGRHSGGWAAHTLCYYTYTMLILILHLYLYYTPLIYCIYSDIVMYYYTSRMSCKYTR